MAELTETKVRPDTPIEGEITTTQAVIYTTERTRQYYGNPGDSRVRADEITVEEHRGALYIRRGQRDPDVYVHGPWPARDFVSDASVPGKAGSPLGTVFAYVWKEGPFAEASEKRPVHQIALLGLHKNSGKFAFLRIFDFLGKPLPESSEDPVELLFSRGGQSGPGTSPQYEFELVLEAGSVAALHRGRPTDVNDTAHPAIGYLSGPGVAYYTGTPASAQPEGYSQWINVCWTQGFLVQENARVHVAADPRDLVDELYDRIRFDERTFLDGFLRFYRFRENPDPGASPQPVHRVAVLGLTHEHKFGFLRLFDSLGHGHPIEISQERIPPDPDLPFDFMTSHDNGLYGRFNRELVVEVGSPTALIR